MLPYLPLSEYGFQCLFECAGSPSSPHLKAYLQMPSSSHSGLPFLMLSRLSACALFFPSRIYFPRPSSLTVCALSSLSLSDMLSNAPFPPPPPQVFSNALLPPFIIGALLLLLRFAFQCPPPSPSTLLWLSLPSPSLPSLVLTLGPKTRRAGDVASPFLRKRMVSGGGPVVEDLSVEDIPVVEDQCCRIYQW